MPPSCGCLLLICSSHMTIFVFYLWVWLILGLPRRELILKSFPIVPSSFVSHQTHTYKCGYDESVAWSKQAHNVLLCHQGNKSRGIGEKLLMYPSSIYCASSVYPTTIFFTRVYLTTKSCWDPHGVRPKEMDDHMPWMHGGGSQPMDHIERWIPRGHASMRSQIRMVEQGCHASISKSHQCKS